VVAHAGGNTFAFLVDEILSEQEVLPKSLGKQLRRVRFITGATQLGDGSLVPILGLEDIARYGLATGDGATLTTRHSTRLLRPKRVLVTEDSITSRLLLKHLLEGAGYQVETAVDGLDALSKLRHEDFDALVSDIEMPRLDGLALTEHVRGNPKSAEMPVVLVTSLKSPEERERGLRAGADAYVLKGSFDQDNLLATIRRLI
jgi:two-component system chemotaxis sensor kinase CheA